jgi:hypothetical protein
MVVVKVDAKHHSDEFSRISTESIVLDGMMNTDLAESHDSGNRRSDRTHGFDTKELLEINQLVQTLDRAEQNGQVVEARHHAKQV